MLHVRVPQYCRVFFLLLFSTHRVLLCHLLSLRPCVLSSITSTYITRGTVLVYSFDEISVAEFGFKEFSYSSELPLSYFFFNLCLFGGVHFEYLQVILISFHPKSSDAYPWFVVLLLFLLSSFSFLARHISKSQIPFLYLGCTFL